MKALTLGISIVLIAGSAFAMGSYPTVPPADFSGSGLDDVSGQNVQVTAPGLVSLGALQGGNLSQDPQIISVSSFSPCGRSQ